MISPISFKGTYRIDSAKNNDFSEKIVSISNELYNLGNYEQCENFDSINNMQMTYIIDDKFDEHLESFMISKGINFKKFSKNELSSEEGIKSRIIMDVYHSEPEFHKVEIDTEKFNKAYKEYGFAYIGDKGKIVGPERCKAFGEFLKTGSPIYASIVYISDNGISPEIDFQDGRHRYAFYRDMGMKSIPVTMNQESISVARKYGILAE